MISCSHWGMFDVPESNDYDFDFVSPPGKNPQYFAVSAVVQPVYRPASVPSWWAGSTAYQNLNFGPYLS